MKYKEQEVSKSSVNHVLTIAPSIFKWLKIVYRKNNCQQVNYIMHI